LDILIYLLLFVILNAIAPREHGSAALPINDIFKRSAWRRLFSSSQRIEAISTDIYTERAAIEVCDLSKVYHGFTEVHALEDVNFRVDRGEVIVVVGPNGAGKSTLLNALTGTLQPSSGTLRLFGGPISSSFRDIRAALGVCFQENVLLEELSVKEHFILFGAFRGIEDLESQVSFFADTLQLRDSLDGRAKDLSGGQKRKLCIALALLGRPPVVVMDEPTAGVDVQARQLIWRTIAALRDVTAVVTSHALEEAEAVSSRLFIVAGGRLVFQGTSTELRRQYRCGYLLKIDGADEDAVGRVLALAQKHVADARTEEDRPGLIAMSVAPGVPALLRELRERSEEIGVATYSFAVENLEDMLMKLIMAGESQIQTGKAF
jgi:ABC-type multidrug transport system ATPase subunit